MKFIRLLFICLSLSSLSCFSLSIDKLVEVNIAEDWLFIGGNLEKSNVSKSKSPLNPPFNLYWEFDVDGGLAKNCLSASDAILFVNTLNAEFFAIDITTGKSLGRASTTGRASYSTPLIFNNNVIITSSGDKSSKIFSYNLVRGISQWQKNIGWIESSPVLFNENIIVSSLNGKLYKINVKTGQLIWTTKPSKKNFSGSFYTSPTICGNLILAGNEDGNMYAFDVNSGKEIWNFSTGASIFCDASSSDGKIYFGSDDKYFYCIDTLGKLVWEKNLNSKFLSSPTFYNNSVITAGIDGTVYSLEKSDGNVKWKFITKGAIWASPLLHIDKIFIGSFDRNFYCISAEKGEELWKYACEGRIRTSAITWKDFIFVASDEKYVYCFSNKVYTPGKSLN